MLNFRPASKRALPALRGLMELIAAFDRDFPFLVEACTFPFGKARLPLLTPTVQPLFPTIVGSNSRLGLSPLICELLHQQDSIEII